MSKSFIKSMALLLLLFCGSIVQAKGQNVALKTNFLYWGAWGSPNGAVELALGKQWTTDIYGGANLWKFGEQRDARHWAVQPEVRYWFCESFNGHFVGLHGHGGQFNVGGWDLPFVKDLKDHRYQGYFWGAGLSYGYQWLLGKHWNLEASIGAGFARINYDKFPCVECGARIAEGTHNYFGVTRATLSLVYIF